jgi:hypothetical protein
MIFLWGEGWRLFPLHGFLRFLALAEKGEIDRRDNQHVGDRVVPPERLVEQKVGDNSKNSERDAFLDDLQLREGKLLRADAIGWDLKDVLEERHPQLAKMANRSGSLLYFRWPYHAMVIKTFEMMSRMTVFTTYLLL